MKLSLKWLYDVKALAYVIIAIVAVVALAAGIYILSPVFVAVAQGYNETSPILAGLVSYGAIPIVGGLLVGSSIATYLGIFLRKTRLVKYGSFSLAIMFIFLAALRLFAVGVFPLIWLNILALGLIAAVCRLVIE